MKAPAIERYRVTLRLTAPARFHFLHGAVLRGLLSRALGEHDLPIGVIPATPASGRTTYQAGEAYHLGLTLVGEDRAVAGRLLAGLTRLGESTPDGQRSPTLGGNFEVEAAEPLEPPDLEAEAAALAGGADDGAAALTLQLLSPLRLERPEPLKVRGAAYLNDDCFPATHFLDRLAARLRRLAGSQLGPAPASAERVTAIPQGLTWIDLPVPGVPGKGRSYTLGGVLGRVELAAVPVDWLPWLVLGRHLHVGASTGFGFGRYRIAETDDAFPEPFRPARSALQRAASHERLEAALDHVLESSDTAGEDGVEPDDFARGSERRLGEIAHQLSSGRFRPSPLTGCLLRKADGGLRPLAIPTVRDRVAQRAVGQVLAEAPQRGHPRGALRLAGA